MMKNSNMLRMLFLYRGWNSGTNQAVLKAWQSELPELNIIACNVCPLSQKLLGRKLAALPHAVRRGGVGVFSLGTGNFTDAVKRSTWYMKEVKKEVHRIQRQDDYDFSLSMSTVLPVINPQRPNFIYTDLTILANCYYPEGQDWIKLWEEYLPYERETINSAAAVFTMSDHVSTSLREQYGLSAAKVHRVNGGCNAPLTSDPDPLRFQQQRILFIGVDWERKGGPELVKAFQIIQKSYPSATLTIVGCRPCLPGVRNINIVGPVPQDAIPHYLEQATVFCMPSKREPFGIVFLEAMQAGLPVIASRFGAAPDFIIDGETGYKVDPFNIDQLARCIETVIGNPERSKEMGENGAALVRAKYTWKHTQNEMWHIIKNHLQV